MLLYLVQHAEAKKEEEDPQRSLSEKGLADIKNVASYAQRLNIKASQIVHSGKTRALQTASILAEYLKPEKGISDVDGLGPLDNPHIWSERIAKLKDDTIIVGHLPHLGRLASLILCNDQEKNIISFKMSGIVCLKKFGDSGWSVEWMITSELIR
ncbi:MAG: phosphohistidine phosphatase SixA [Deltaproteobacteria bacterium]|nr:phosphohistidine phosphatase SixA [Deltaproteobacteria bacterium]